MMKRSGVRRPLLPLLLVLSLWPVHPAPARAARAACRDRWLEPFSSDSIWNTAIGSAARFEPAGLFAPGDPRGPPDNFHNDQDFLLRPRASDPVTTWINQGDWNT